VPEPRYLSYERLRNGTIVRITLQRPQFRNAQNRGLLVELAAAFEDAEADDQVRVVILAGAGPVFSAGHDLGTADTVAEQGEGASRHPTYSGFGATRPAAERRMLQEWHFFFQNTLRWRNLRKILIAQVHGDVLAAGLMLMWCCDLIVAAEQTTFADVVGTRLGMCGLEYFAHPWEFGPRKAKELLLTGDSISVDEAYHLGMVSKVFPAEALAQRTLEFADRVARLPTVTALLIKESVNQSVDNMGFFNALQSCFTLHQLNHSHWAELHDNRIPAGLPEDGIESWRTAPPVTPAIRNQPRAPDRW
jgi:enoyl-CoA hydratase/carnithine racemase